MATERQIQDHVTRVRQAATELISVMDDLRALRREWDSLVSGSVDAETPGENAGITNAMIADVYFTAETLETTLASGHYVNLFKVKL